MANAIYLDLVGIKQGHISKDAFTEESVGNIFQDGHTDQIFIYSLAHTLNIPTDPQSGQPTGQRMHGPITFTKPIDRTTPLLAAALTSGERMERCQFQWFRTSATGTQEHYFTTLLEDAVIVNITTISPDTQAEGHVPAKESISLTYRKITWEHNISGTSGADDWRKPVA